jgi:hypothetical protein
MRTSVVVIQPASNQRPAPAREFKGTKCSACGASYSSKPGVRAGAGKYIAHIDTAGCARCALTSDLQSKLFNFDIDRHGHRGQITGGQISASILARSSEIKKIALWTCVAQNSKGSALSSFAHHGSHTAREREDSGSEPDLLPIVELEPRICLGLAFKKSTRAPMVIRPLLLALPFFVNELARPFPPSSLIIRRAWGQGWECLFGRPRIWRPRPTSWPRVPSRCQFPRWPGR